MKIRMFSFHFAAVILLEGATNDNIESNGNAIATTESLSHPPTNQRDMYTKHTWCHDATVFVSFICWYCCAIVHRCISGDNTNNNNRNNVVNRTHDSCMQWRAMAARTLLLSYGSCVRTYLKSLYFTRRHERSDTRTHTDSLCHSHAIPFVRNSELPARHRGTRTS